MCMATSRGMPSVMARLGLLSASMPRTACPRQLQDLIPPIDALKRRVFIEFKSIVAWHGYSRHLQGLLHHPAHLCRPERFVQAQDASLFQKLSDLRAKRVAGQEDHSPQ